MRRAITFVLICALLMFGTMAAFAAQTSPARPALISYEQAIEVALERVGGGTVTRIYHDRERFSDVLLSFFNVEIRYAMRDYDIRVDSDTGEIVRFRYFPQANPQITHGRAIEIALEKVGGGMQTEVDFHRERDGEGALYYDVHVRHEMREYEVRIDANTGEITRFLSGDVIR